MHFVFSTLAMNQTQFFSALGVHLKNQGHDVSIITFHERSCDYVHTQGLTAYNVYSLLPKLTGDLDIEFAKTCNDFGVAHPNLMLSHEKEAFELSDETNLKQRFCQFVRAVDIIMAGITAKSPNTVVLQETGGFLSLLSLFFVAQKRKLVHLFIEPSIFRGRVFFVHNSWFAPAVKDNLLEPICPEVRDYIAKTLETQKIVIPVKDQSHYRSIFAKLLTPRNYRRLVEKTWDKHVLRKSEEFSHIGQHVRKHLRMAISTRRLQPHYCQISDEPFVYYPLHVPADMALTLRSPAYLDQYNLIECIARSLPPGYKLVIKEHPAMVGAIDASRVLSMLKKYPNLRLLHPFINNYDVFTKAAALVTVNSKSGAEALLKGKRVLVLGDAFYKDTRVVKRIDSLTDLPDALKDLLSSAAPDSEAITQFFQNTWSTSYPGEIYVDTPENISTFSNSIAAFLKKVSAHS